MHYELYSLLVLFRISDKGLENPLSKPHLHNYSKRGFFVELIDCSENVKNKKIIMQ
jgi:hypothetical protein